MLLEETINVVFSFFSAIYNTKTSYCIWMTSETFVFNRSYVFCMLDFVVISLMYVSMSVCLCVCVYVCSHVKKLFLNRFSIMIYPHTRIHNRNEPPKTDLKSNQMSKSYSGKNLITQPYFHRLKSLGRMVQRVNGRSSTVFCDI